MSLFYGTSGDDVLDQTQLGLPPLTRILGGAGNDRILISSLWAHGEEGDDYLIDVDKRDSVASYFNSPSGILVDLASEYALDGFGGRDTLVNFYEVHASDFNDELFGTESEDKFQPSRGTDLVDGRGGNDIVVINGNRNDFLVDYIEKSGEILVSGKNGTSQAGEVKRLLNIEQIQFNGDEASEILYTRYEFPQMANTANYRFSEEHSIDLTQFYNWSGWHAGAVSLNFLLTSDLDLDGRDEIIFQAWQLAKENQVPYFGPTPNRLGVLKWTETGYRDATSEFFVSTEPIILGAERGGVGYAAKADLNNDGRTDFVFALNRDDVRIHTGDTGSSYPTAIMSQPGGKYVVQEIAEPNWQYAVYVVDLGAQSEVWFSYLGSITRQGVTYSDSTGLFVDGMPSYRFDTAIGKWVQSGLPPTGGVSVFIPESAVTNGKLDYAFAMVYDSSFGLSPDETILGSAYRAQLPALMKQDVLGDWKISQVIKTYAHRVEDVWFSGKKYKGLVGTDSFGSYVETENYFMGEAFQFFPGSQEIFMAKRSVFPIELDADGKMTVEDSEQRLDFYWLNNGVFSIAPIEIVNPQFQIFFHQLEYTDFNNDGLSDILIEGSVIGRDFGGQPTIYLNTGSGKFVHIPYEYFPVAHSGQILQSKVVDLNEDDIPDIFYYKGGVDPAHVPQIYWEGFLAESYLDGNQAIKDNLVIEDRNMSPRIFTWGGSDTLSDKGRFSGETDVNLGLGFDVVKYSGGSKDYLVSWEKGVWAVVEGSATDRIQFVERLDFSDRSVIIESAEHGDYGDVPEDLYRFFVVAFDAAPGVTYFDQLAQAYRSGMSVKEIVDVFISKDQFTSRYEKDLTVLELSERLVQNIVKDGASLEVKRQAVEQLEAAFKSGMSRGDVIFEVFGNLAEMPFTDPVWGGVSRLLANEVSVSRAYTELMSQSTTDIDTLRSVLSVVTKDSQAQTDELAIELAIEGMMGLGQRSTSDTPLGLSHLGDDPSARESWEAVIDLHQWIHPSSIW